MSDDRAVTTRLALVLAVLVLALALLWIAAEQHYENCIRAAEQRTYDPFALNEAIDDCSRLPW
jgi:hypothetical protein